MRIAMVEPSGFSGICQYSYCLCNALAAAGHEVALITSDRYEMAAEVHRFEVHLLYRWLVGSLENRGIWRFGLVRKILRGTRYLMSSLVVAGWIVRHRPDVVHFQMMRGTDFPLALLVRLLPVRFIYTAHEVAPEPSSRWAMDWVYYRYIYSLAGKIIVHSPGDAEKLRRVFHVPPAKVGVTPLGNYLFLAKGEEMDGKEARRRLDLPEESKVVLFFGVLRANKGLEYLIEAFAQVARECAQSRLLVSSYVKRGVADFTPYADAIGRLGLADRVFLHLGYIPNEEVPLHFGAADVVVLPYTSSHNSGVVQVAYAFGRPVVATDVGSFARVIEQGRTGWVVPARDTEGLARAIVRILTDGEEARRMGRYAREVARERYSWDHIAALTLDIYGKAPGNVRNGNGLPPARPAAGFPTAAGAEESGGDEVRPS